jgi:hypothetical protein
MPIPLLRLCDQIRLGLQNFTQTTLGNPHPLESVAKLVDQIERGVDKIPANQSACLGIIGKSKLAASSARHTNPIPPDQRCARSIDGILDCSPTHAEDTLNMIPLDTHPWPLT